MSDSDPIDPAPRDRSTPRRQRPATPVPEPQAPGPLIALMGSLIAILIIAALITGEWVFLLLGVFGLAAGLVPFFSRR